MEADAEASELQAGWRTDIALVGPDLTEVRQARALVVPPNHLPRQPCMVRSSAGLERPGQVGVRRTLRK